MNEGKDRAQLGKFKALAREVEADEDENKFDELLRRMREVKPEDKRSVDD